MHIRELYANYLVLHTYDIHYQNYRNNFACGGNVSKLMQNTMTPELEHKTVYFKSNEYLKFFGMFKEAYNPCVYPQQPQTEGTHILLWTERETCRTFL